MDLDHVYSNLKIEYGGIVSSIIEQGNSPKIVIRSTASGG